MGTNRRYANVKMFDHTYRVETETPGGKPGVLFSSDDFAKADAAYEKAIAEKPACPVYLLQRARVIKKFEPD